MANPPLTMPIATLLADPHNPREIDEASATGLGVSLERFGDLSRIVLNTRNGLLVAGHQRVAQLTAAGATEWTTTGPDSGFILHPKTGEKFSIRLVDWSDADHRVANLTANNPKIQGSYTAEAAEMLAAMEDSVDYSALRLDALAEELAAADTKPDAQDADLGGGIPEPPRVPITKAGDLWLLGEHRLLCGDARLAADIDRVTGGDQINVAVTSPPYASQRKYDESSGFKPIHPDEYVEWFEAVQAGIGRHLAPDGSFFLNIKENCDDGQRVLYVKDLTLAHVRRWGWRLIDEFCWRNTSEGVPGGWNNRFKNAWEPVFHFSRQQSIKFHADAVSHYSDDVFDYSPNNEKAGSGSGLLGSERGNGRRAGLARPSNVLELSAESGQGDHTAPYPLGLPSFFIKAFSDPGDVVFDPFCGSGTTLVAAQTAGRRCVATEISPAYCDVIVERWQNATGLKATRES